MAKHTIIRLLDDLNPEQEAAETVRFGLDGVQYEIDLTSRHAKELRAALEPFRYVARRAQASASATGNGKRSNGNGGRDRDHNRLVREWARGEGYPVANKGRVSPRIMAEYSAAMANGSRPPAPKPEPKPEPAPVPEVKPEPAVEPDEYDRMKRPALLALAQERGASSITRAKIDTIRRWLRDNPNGTQYAQGMRAAGEGMRQAKASASPAKPAPQTPPSRAGLTLTQKRDLCEQVRAFAKLHGHDLKPGGRIPEPYYVAQFNNDPSLLPPRKG
jgi:hypothetical protein